MARERPTEKSHVNELGPRGYRLSVEDLLRCESSFRRLASRMLDRFPLVRRWEETDDIVQDATLRLLRALRSTEPESELHAKRIAALQIRRQLLDLARNYARPGSAAANHQTGFEDPDRLAVDCQAPPSLWEWSELHRCVADLPPAPRATFELIWYGDYSQNEAAAALGLSVRQVQRHWRTARILLQRRIESGVLLDDNG